MFPKICFLCSMFLVMWTRTSHTNVTVTKKFVVGKISYYNITRNNSLIMIYNERLVCCASLLKLDLAITNAYCFIFNKETKMMLAIAGTTDMRNYDPLAQVRLIKRVIIHEGYVPFQMGSDNIALVQMEIPFVRNWRVGTAKFATKYLMNINQEDNYIHIGGLNYKNKHTYIGVVADIYYKGKTSYECPCKELINDTTPQFDKEGNVTSKFFCLTENIYYDNGTQRKEILEKACVFNNGCPLYTRSGILIAILSQGFKDSCMVYPPPYDKTLKWWYQCLHASGSTSLYMQLYPYYIDWIMSHLPKPDYVVDPRILLSNGHGDHNEPDAMKYLPLIIYFSCFSIFIIVYCIFRRIICVHLVF